MEKFLCKLFNVAEYIFTQNIVTLFFFLSFLKYYSVFLPAFKSTCSFVVNATKVRRIIDLTEYYIKDLTTP